MRRPVHILFLFFIIFVPFRMMAEEEKDSLRNREEVNIGILHNIFNYASRYSRLIDEYDAELYIKAYLHVHKSNHWVRYVPSMIRFEKGVKDYINESVSEIHYTAPDIYDRKIKANVSTFPKNKGQITDVYDYINLNIYSATMMTNKILSPLDRANKKYYKYYMDSIVPNEKAYRYKIRIVPKFKSTQLVSGYMWVKEHSWNIQTIYIEGIYDVILFKMKVDMGDKGNEEFVPVHYDLDLRFKFAWNDLQMKATADMAYKNIKLYDEFAKRRKRRNKHRHDLTKSYTLSVDTTKLINTQKEFEQFRPKPLSSDELALYFSYYMRQADMEKKKYKKQRLRTKSQVFWGQVGDMLTDNYYLNLKGIGNVKCSPLLNPFLLDYSHSRGWSYRQKFKYNRFFTNSERMLRVAPQIGYNFKDKQLYLKLNTEWQYWPQKQGSIELTAGNNRRIFSSMVIDQLKEWPDSTFNMNKKDMDYFKDINVELMNSIEVVNGLTIKLGINMHHRTLVNKSSIELRHPMTDKEWAKLRNIDYSYNSFAPRIVVQWTPHQYYYMNGKRKMNLPSVLPTFSIDYERAFPRIFGCRGTYERIEVDIRQHIKLTSIRSISYRLGGGAFTRHRGMYFVDFENFRRHNVPEDWNDEIGGTFQLLASRWFNTSRRYIRGHFTYESPFILLRPLNKWLGRVQVERLYLGLLRMPGIKSYVELGYGIGTHIFDAGVFVNNMNGNKMGVGCKFTFELFRD